MIQSGLLSKWNQVNWTLQFGNIKELIKNNNESNENLSLNQVLFAFYILTFCLPFSLAILFIEVLCFLSINNFSIFHKHFN